MNRPTANAETVAAARLLLTQLGISPADLVTVGTTAPTFGEIDPRVRETLEAGTKRTPIPVRAGQQCARRLALPGELQPSREVILDDDLTAFSCGIDVSSISSGSENRPTGFR